MKKYTPIFIPTLCRYEHFRECVESLKSNPDAKYTALYIGFDYPANDSHVSGWEKINKYLDQISGFNQINIIRRCENWGSYRNMTDVLTKILQDYDSYIYTEDDCVFSRNFLGYINWGIEKFMLDKNVYAICGYTHNNATQTTKQYDFFRSKRFSAWGYATWKNRNMLNFFSEKTRNKIFNNILGAIKVMKTDTEIFNMLWESHLRNLVWGDVLVDCSMIINKNLHVIQPTVTLSRNLGYDGSGEHCETLESFLNKELLREIDQRMEFNGKKELPNDLLKIYEKDRTQLHDYLPWLKRYLRFLIFRGLSNVKHHFWRNKCK